MKTPIRRTVQALEAYVPGEQPSDPDIVKLNTNENPYPPSPRVLEALAGVDPEVLRQYPDPVCRRLRARIAELHGCDETSVFVGNGSDEVLALCTRAFVENDGSIGYFEPSYSLYPVLADIREASRKPVALGEDFDWRMPDGYDCSLFFLATPNAPTGRLYPRSEVAGFCGDLAGVLVLDEAYADFAREHFVGLALAHDNVLAVRSLSKSYSLAGLRLGYAVGPATLIEALSKIKDSYNADALSQALALAALEDQDHMRANVARIKATRARLSGELTALGHQVTPSETNFLWVRPSGMAAKDFFSRLREYGILVRYFAGERTGDFVRITVGTDREVGVLLETVRQKLRT